MYQALNKCWFGMNRAHFDWMGMHHIKTNLFSGIYTPAADCVLGILPTASKNLFSNKHGDVEPTLTHSNFSQYFRDVNHLR